MSDKLTFVGGLRVIKEEKDYFFTQSLYTAPTNARDIHQGFQIIIGPTYPGGVPTAFTDSTSDTLFAGKLHFDYRPNENLLLYAGLNRGIKAGSFNAQLAGGLPIPDSAIPYQEEVLTSLEAGFKHTLANGHTRINGTVFYYDYEDYQAFLFTGVSGVVVNNDADNYGIELDIQSSPMEGLDLLFAASWFDATVKDVPLRVSGPIIRDVDPVYAPEIQASGLVRYEWPINNGKLHVQADFSYSDDYFYNLRNFDADKYDSYTKIGAGFGWTNDADDLSITFSARNLTDERIGIQGFDLATLCGCNEISFQPPRWLGLNVKVSF
jgi:iron complex outermembrane receptor protein